MERVLRFGITEHWGQEGAGRLNALYPSPHFRAEKTEAREGDFPAGARTVRDVCARGGGGGCRSSPSRPWGPSQGSVRQTHHPRALRGEHQGAPGLGGDLGGTPAESNPQPHTSQEQLGSHQGERQLSCWVFFCSFAKLFPLPFCFSFCRGTQRCSSGAVCHQSLAPPLSSKHRLFLPAA